MVVRIGAGAVDRRDLGSDKVTPLGRGASVRIGVTITRSRARKALSCLQIYHGLNRSCPETFASRDR